MIAKSANTNGNYVSIHLRFEEVFVVQTQIILSCKSVNWSAQRRYWLEGFYSKSDNSWDGLKPLMTGFAILP